MISCVKTEEENCNALILNIYNEFIVLESVRHSLQPGGCIFLRLACEVHFPFSIYLELLYSSKRRIETMYIFIIIYYVVIDCIIDYIDYMLNIKY